MKISLSYFLFKFRSLIKVDDEISVYSLLTFPLIIFSPQWGHILAISTDQCVALCRIKVTSLTGLDIVEQRRLLTQARPLTILEKVVGY